MDTNIELQQSWETGGLHFAKVILLNLSMDIGGGTIPFLSSVLGLPTNITYELMHQLYHEDKTRVMCDGRFWYVNG
jgi:hypothetical protein